MNFEKNILDCGTLVRLNNGVEAVIKSHCTYKKDMKMRYTIKERRGIHDIFPSEIESVLSIAGTVANWDIISKADLIKQLINGDKVRATKVYVRRYKKMPNIK